MSGSSSPNDPEANPFVAFRHFVDDEIRTAFGAYGFQPSPATRGSEEHSRSALRRYGDNYERAMNPERTRIQPRSGEKQVSSSFDNAASPTQIGASEPSFDAMFNWERSAADNTYRPTTNFLRYSPYSPVNLRLMDDAEKEWESAFEHLLAIMQGQHDYSPPRRMPHLASPTYINRLQEQGLASDSVKDTKEQLKDTFWEAEGAVWGVPKFLQPPPSWSEKSSAKAPSSTTQSLGNGRWNAEFQKDMAAANTQDGEDDVDEDYDNADEEEDHVYEFSRYTQLPYLMRHQLSSGTEYTEETCQDAQDDGVVSRVRRTEKRTLADGSTVTKTTSRRIYANGYEESEEDTEVSPPQSLSKSVSVQDSKSPLRAAIEEQKQKKGSGWFWSS